MNQAQLNQMIEQATPAEQRQLKACINVHLNTVRDKMRKRMASARNQLEQGISEEDIKAENAELRKEVIELSIKEAAYLDKIAKLKAEINTTNLF